MDQILGLTSQPNQTTTIVLEDGTSATIALRYYAQQRGWFYDITWGDFVCNGNLLVPAPNILLQYEKLMPFGIMVLTTNNVEIVNIDDFTSGVCQLYLLNQADRAEVNASAYPSRTP